MSEPVDIASIEDYPPLCADAKRVIQILVKHDLICSHSNEETYLKIWDAALEISGAMTMRGSIREVLAEDKLQASEKEKE